MPAQSATKATIPVGSDGWNPVAHIKQLSDTTRSAVPVADKTERDTLAARFPGGVLPIPTIVSRLDVAGAPLEIWDGATWASGMETYTFPVDYTNGWSTYGKISRTRLSDGTSRYFMDYLASRNLAGLTINSGLVNLWTSIPAGWRPATPVNMHYYGALKDNFQNFVGPLNIQLHATNGSIGVSTLTGNTLTLPQYGAINFVAQWTQ